MVTRLRLLMLLLLAGAQVAGIVRARVVATRYLCWAPYDQISFYRIAVRRGDTALSPEDVTTRYRWPSIGRENRSIHHVIAAVAQYEQTYGRRDPVEAEIHYRVNGGREEVWSWR